MEDTHQQSITLNSRDIITSQAKLQTKTNFTTSRFNDDLNDKHG